MLFCSTKLLFSATLFLLSHSRSATPSHPSAPAAPPRRPVHTSTAPFALSKKKSSAKVVVPPVPVLDPGYEYKGGTILVGHWSQMTRTFSTTDIDLFAHVSGDHNPIHLNPVYAVHDHLPVKVICRV